MIGGDAVRNRLKDHRFSSSWRSHNQRPLPHSYWRGKIDDSSGHIPVTPFEFQTVVGKQWSEVVKKDFFRSDIWRFKIHLLNLQKSIIALTFFRRPDLPRNCITCA